MQTFKYCDLLARLHDFDSWLLSLGLMPRSNDRIHQALDTLRMADEAVRKGRATGEYVAIRPEHLFPLIEALEAHDIFSTFENESSETLASSVKRALSGPAQAADENEKNSEGRNIWFELALAAQWRSFGANVQLGEPDLLLSRGETTFLVACKRPAQQNSVRANIRGAISQLNDSLKVASEGTYGVVAISLARILNPGTKFWTGDIEQFGNLLHQSALQYRKHWQSADADPRICAILFHAATPGKIGSTVEISHVSYSVAEPLGEYSVGTSVFAEHVREMKTQSS